MPKYEIIAPHDVADQTKSILSSLPSGKNLENKVNPDSNLYKFWSAVSMSMILLEEDINKLYQELTPELTEQLITEWERQYGIPDLIFQADGTIEERRSDILAKLSANGLQTKIEFEEFFEFIGYDIDIIANGNTPGVYGWPWQWIGSGVHPWSTNSEDQNRFWILVKFNQDYDNLDVLQVYMQTLVPANCIVVFFKEEEI